MKTPLTLLFILLLSFLETSANKKAGPSTPQLSPMSQKSQGFIENKGQIIDQNNQPNKEVLYIYNGSGLHVQLRQNGFSYEVIKEAIKSQPLAIGENNQIPDSYNQKPLADSIYIHRIDILFEGGNKNVKITPFEPSIDYINYYTTGTGEAGITSVHHYQKIVYTNIYPKIDIEFVLNQVNTNHHFKYNFIIHPGGDINDIKLKFLGATNTLVTDDGHIKIETTYGNIDESIPLSYQLNENNTKTEVRARFNYISKNIFGISVDNYQPGNSLIIDPVPWGTYYGGSSREDQTGLYIDKNGDIFISGNSSSSTSIATSGAWQTLLAGKGDAYIAKFNEYGSLLWATYYGGNNLDHFYNVATDTSGNVFAGGFTASQSNMTTSLAYQVIYGGGVYDGLLVKLDASGMRLWATYYGSWEFDEILDLKPDLIGNIIIVGHKYSLPVVAKFSSTGAFLWSTDFGSTVQATVEALDIDRYGNILITGTTASATGLATTGAWQTSNASSGGIQPWDAYLAKFDSSGILKWATYYGGPNLEIARDLSLDTSGNIFVTGQTVSDTGLFLMGAHQLVLKGGDDLFIVKFNPLGTPQWGTYYGDVNSDFPRSIINDEAGNVYITGGTTSASGIATGGTYQPAYSKYKDAFVIKFSNNGTLLWGTYLGDSLDEEGDGVAIDTKGNVIIAGVTSSLDRIATTGAYQTIQAGNFDAFIFAMPANQGIVPIVNNIISANQPICSGALPATLTGSIPSGGNGSYYYTWLSSVINASTGFGIATGTSNGINYSPPALTTNTWYKRAVYSAGIDDTSNVVAILVGSVKLNVGFTVNSLIQCIKTNNFIFTDTTSGSNTHFWDFGNGVTSTLANPNISYNFNITNAYWVRLESSINGGCIDSAKQRVFVINNPAPTGAIIGNSVVTRLSTHTYSVPATMGSSYQWIFTHGIGSSTNNSINIKWNTIGTIDLKVVEFTGGGCAGDTVYQTITINPGVGLEGFEPNDEFIIYPNPNHGIFTILSNQIQPYQISVFDMLGKMILQAHHDHSVLENKIDLSAFDDGVYSVQITDENGNSIIQKILLIK